MKCLKTEATGLCVCVVRDTKDMTDGAKSQTKGL